MMRSFIAAAIQIAPLKGPLSRESVAANCFNAVAWIESCVTATGAELVVLPESASTGFTPDCTPEELWDLVSEIPGPVTDPIADVARRLGVHVVWGTYERGPERGVVYNSAVLIGPEGEVLGTYRKTHPFCTELLSRGGWVTPGDEVVVVDTELGRIGMMICFDGDYPELARIQALHGAEVIARPSALLRSVDIWELTTRARAYDNHVYVVAANATGSDVEGTIYFGNSLIVSPIGEVRARATSHESWVIAQIGEGGEFSSITPGSSIGQGFDHLADRNLNLIKRYLDDLASPRISPFSAGAQLTLEGTSSHD